MYVCQIILYLFFYVSGLEVLYLANASLETWQRSSDYSGSLAINGDFVHHMLI